MNQEPSLFDSGYEYTIHSCFEPIPPPYFADIINILNTFWRVLVDTALGESRIENQNQQPSILKNTKHPLLVFKEIYEGLNFSLIHYACPQKMSEKEHLQFLSQAILQILRYSEVLLPLPFSCDIISHEESRNTIFAGALYLLLHLYLTQQCENVLEPIRVHTSQVSILRNLFLENAVGASERFESYFETRKIFEHMLSKRAFVVTAVGHGLSYSPCSLGPYYLVPPVLKLWCDPYFGYLKPLTFYSRALQASRKLNDTENPIKSKHPPREGHSNPSANNLVSNADYDFSERTTEQGEDGLLEYKGDVNIMELALATAEKLDRVYRTYRIAKHELSQLPRYRPKDNLDGNESFLRRPQNDNIDDQRDIKRAKTGSQSVVELNALKFVPQQINSRFSLDLQRWASKLGEKRDSA